MAEDYLKREAFIWEDLLASGASTVKVVRKKWPRGGVPRMLFAWPAEVVKTDDGSPIEGMISLAVPAEANVFTLAVEMARRAKAYALMLVEQRDGVVKVILESPHGAKCWTLPVRRHGDVTVVEEGSYTQDEECLGILWRKSQGSG